jgi:hypothetical protein
VQRPDYRGGSIVNLMSSLVTGLGGRATGYPALRALDPGRVAAARRVVLLVIDGLGYDFLVGQLAGAALRAGLVDRIDSVFPPTTATAVTTFLTGLAPRQHGLVGWYTYLREAGTVATVLPYTARYGRLSLAAAGVSAAALYGLTPVFDRVPVACAAVLPAHIADSEVSRALGGRARRVAYRSLGGLFRRTVEAVRRSAGRAFVYVYWAELDRLAHRHGVTSPQVAAHLAELDARFAAFLTALAGTDTLLVVAADHGFIDVPRAHRLRLEDFPGLADALVLPLCGEPRTVYCYVRPRRAGRFAEDVATSLGAAAQARPSDALIEEDWFGIGDTHPRLAERVGDWTLLMGDGYALTDRLVGERPHPMVGFHGGTTPAEMRVPLMIWHV